MTKMGMFAVVSIVVLAGCVKQAPQLVNTQQFDFEEVAWAVKDGSNTVTGFAVLRTVGGEARTCAGLEARLTPDSSYARERMTTLYGSTSQGTLAANTIAGGKSYDPAKTNSSYVSSSRSTRCDGQGHFTFDRVPDGIWYATAIVVWSANPRSGQYEGGTMMKRIEVRGGQTVRVTLP